MPETSKPAAVKQIAESYQKPASPIERSETKHERCAHSIVKVHTDQMKVNAVDMDLLQVATGTVPGRGV